MNSMNVVYSSPHYYVAEYPVQNGFELINLHQGTGTFLRGEIASSFRRSLATVIAGSPTVEVVDEFLENFDGLMIQPALLH
ncbi:MAG: DUF3567 family protein [Burkholderiales bacterium]